MEPAHATREPRGKTGEAAARVELELGKAVQVVDAVKELPEVVVKAVVSFPPDAPEVVLSGNSKEEQWRFLEAKVLSDKWCQSQLKPGKRLVFGEGDLNASIFFCGEAPGEDEETAGRPFIGKAGELLTKIIKAMGLSRESVYIANVMNYRPPMPSSIGNRPPSKEELAYCLPYLLAQIEIVQPQVIVALGKTAVDGLLGPDPKRRMSDLRGQWQQYNQLSFMPTYHPSYLLRDARIATKRLVWQDMLKVMERVGLPISDRQRKFFT